ncbi:MAG TPA: hypothetical protein VFF68_03425 [Anaerolineaceae bacterium]|nr:hypothetical protein [Anaerolineaceae bacterium]
MAEAQDRQASALEQWVGVLASPVIWTLHLLIGYAVAEAGCFTGVFGSETTLRGVLIWLTALGLVGIVFNVVWGYARWRQFRHGSSSVGEDLRAFDRSAFMALAGLLLSVLFGALLLINLYPFLVLTAC